MPDRKDSLVEHEGSRISPVLPLVGLAVLAALILVYFFYFRSNSEPVPVIEPALAPVPAPVAPVPVATPEPSVPTHPPTPVPAIPTAEPLPPLNESDAVVKDEMAVKGLADLVVFLTPDEVIRKTVRAVYSLSKGNVVQQYRPVTGPDSSFSAVPTGDTVTIENPREKGEMTETAVYRLSAQNGERYQIYINLLRSVDKQQVAALYSRYYPLLQQAYQELGEGPAEFHTVVLQALDSLLASPQPTEEPLLVRTSVQYQYLKPEYQALPATQKLVLRMGNMNRRVLLEELRGLREAIAR